MLRSSCKKSIWIMCLIACITVSVCIFPCNVISQEYTTPFYPEGTYVNGIPTPEDVLGFPIGERPARYEEVVRYITTLAEKSDRVLLFESGETYEHRTMYYLVISSEENLARLDDIVDNGVARLADPRTLSSDDEAQDLIDSIPAVAWMMYSIHGDEFSGTDSSLQLAYQLAAGTDSATENIRRKLVIGIDPMENPDGRERYINQMRQWSGDSYNTDSQSIQHTGTWPWGRTNHYLFDLNRDWFIQAHPESRARVRSLLRWNPQLVVDAHEMGSFDTYLFNPPREPINPNIHKSIVDWWKVFSEDQAHAFDRYGWSYYTREWHEDWFPGYGTSFPSLYGAVGILYEQAQTDGTPIKRPDGTVLTFREAVHHQFVSSLANITTAADNNKALLRNYYELKKEALSKPRKGEIQTYYINPEKNPARARKLVERLMMLGIEVEITSEPVQLKNLHSYWSTEPVKKTLPEGTYVIRLTQPLRPLINSILEFDPRMKTEVLRAERESLEKGRGTRMYEATAWSMLLAYDTDAYVSTDTPSVGTIKVDSVTEPVGTVVNPDPAYGFIIDYRDDSAVDALIELLEKGYTVRCAKKPFTIEGRSYSRGSLLLRVQENPATLAGDLQGVVRKEHANIYGVDTALSEEGPDLGGREFQLLAAPRIALLTGPSISMYSFGTLWHLLDYQLKCRHTVINSTYLNNLDLRKYNVLIMPSAGSGAATYRRILGDSGLKKLKDWVSDGGTLIGVGAGAVFLADSTTAFSKVELRRQALGKLEQYGDAVQREGNAGTSLVDSLTVWEGITDTGSKEKNAQEKDAREAAGEKVSDEKLAEHDRQLRLFMPRGAILRTDLDEEHWMNFGAGEKVPAIVYSSFAFLSKTPVQTPARLGEASQLRVSGLLWPEARERWEKTAYATREAYGRGQVILITGEPIFRSYFYGTGRIFINSLLLGPGFGARQVVEW